MSVFRGIHVDGAREAGVDPDGLRRALSLAAAWVEAGVVPAVGAVVARGGRVAGEVYVGRRRPDRTDAVDAETMWSLASITKPVTATAVMLLVEEGVLSLDEPAHGLLPELLDAPASAFDRHAITLRHLLGHCSGLPGLPENNLDLRRAHRPLEEFVRAMLRQPLLFAPGTAHIYSNCAITAAAEIVGRASAGALGRRIDEPLIGRFHAFVRERVLEIVGMTSTGYHPPSTWDDRIAWVGDTGQEGETWEMSNSAYYRGLGIPWGGMYGTPREIVRFADLFLPGADGVWRLDAPAGEARRLLSSAAARAMRTPQWIVPDAPPHAAPELREGVPNPPRPEVTWGIGWQVQGSGRSLELASPSTYFHGGASGTFVWADPATDVAVAVFTNRASRGWPTDRPYRALFANAVTAALR